MYDIWRSEMIISNVKSMIDITDINIVEMMCDVHEHRLEKRKIQKILNWSISKSTKNICAFIDIYVYYWIFIYTFSTIAISIFDLFRKGKWFLWIDECQIAMKILKQSLMMTSILITLDFKFSVDMIFLNINVSIIIKWDAILE